MRFRNRTKSKRRPGRKYFSRTASRSNGRNRRRSPMRGGYRL